jgi:hypothetical protein
MVSYDDPTSFGKGLIYTASIKRLISCSRQGQVHYSGWIGWLLYVGCIWRLQRLVVERYQPANWTLDKSQTILDTRQITDDIGH